MTPEEKTRNDLTQPFSSWPDAPAITTRIVNQYSRLLQIRVRGEKPDYLLWDGMEIVRTFADPNIEPDVEHFCIAMLVLEGVSSDIASANWDGLIEKATNLLADNQTTLAVCVKPEELQQQPRKAFLFKFHGCAIKAASNEMEYRPFLTARMSQITRWLQDYPAMATRLKALIASKPTLMIGLSGQDANIQGLFSQARNDVQWQWPGERPSVVFSTGGVGVDQQSLLENVYRAAYDGPEHDAINASAAFPAYGKPLLLGLLLHVLTTKLSALLGILLSGVIVDDERAKLNDGLVALRNRLADAAEADRLRFIRSFVEKVGRSIGLLRAGQVTTLPTRYLPLSSTPVQELRTDFAVKTSGLCEAAISLAVLGILLQAGVIQVKASDTTAFGAGILEVESPVAPAKIFFAANANVANNLKNNGFVSDTDSGTILIHSMDIIQPQARSPLGAPGRIGRPGLRQVSISSLIADATTSDDLVNKFRREVGI